MKEHAGYEFTDEEWNIFAPNLHYLSGKYTEVERFSNACEALTKMEDGEANRLFYMATAPHTLPRHH
jgi:glucose-6-phosphate 1-dehydrogenase